MCIGRCDERWACTREREREEGTYIGSCGERRARTWGHVLYREKRKERRACTYEAVVRGGMYREKRKERRLCIYEAVVRGGACTERKGKRGGHVHRQLW